jgi:hypothetical protein
MGQTTETKQAMIRSLIKIGKLTANLMQGLHAHQWLLSLQLAVRA